jgi:hypothetical protein
MGLTRWLRSIIGGVAVESERLEKYCVTEYGCFAGMDEGTRRAIEKSMGYAFYRYTESIKELGATLMRAIPWMVKCVEWLSKRMSK